MIRFSSNLSTMFQSMPFVDRIPAAARAGFDAVETWFPYEVPAEETRALLRRHGLACVGINTVAGDMQAGDWGLSADPGRVEAFRSSVRQAFDYARTIECPCIHVMSGNVAPGDSREDAWTTYASNIDFACREAQPHGLTVMIEPLNAIDRPNYLLQTQKDARRLIDGLGHPNLRIMLDIYHLQRGEGNLAENIRSSLPYAAHVQIADNPGRHEPGTGEINFAFVFSELIAGNYDGYVGCEFFPVAAEAEISSRLHEAYGKNRSNG